MRRPLWGFFYGGLISEEVMERVGIRPSRRRLAWLPGYEITIAPLVNLVPSQGSAVFGVLLETTHEELGRVYGQLAAAYLPYPVLACDMEGGHVAALCYVVPDMAPGPAEAAHIMPLLREAERLGFPEWYIARIRSFLPASPS